MVNVSNTSHISTIESLAFGGSGIVRIDGKVCFVPFSCPGDVVRLAIKQEKKSYCQGVITEIISRSPQRIAPTCTLFGECGGCNWQHIEYDLQLDAKRRIVADALWRGARIKTDLVAETVPSPEIYGYRSRVQFKVHVQDGTLRIGFYRHGTHCVIDAPDGCPVARDSVNQALFELRGVLADFPDIHCIPQINIDCGDKSTAVTINYIGRNLAMVREYLLNNKLYLMACDSLCIQSDKTSSLELVWGNGLLEYLMPSDKKLVDALLLKYKVGGFSQINQLQNIRLLALARKLAELDGSENLLDLYCGNGNFTLALAQNVVSACGIEGDRGSIKSARFNAEHNGLNTVEFICNDIAVAVKHLVSQKRIFDLVLLDPPRSGAGDVVKNIARLGAGKIVYISCDPCTFARDCGIFSESGYTLKSCIPVDMFPQTYHVETISLLERA